MTDNFGILESSVTQWYQDVAPTQDIFFIVLSIVYGFARARPGRSRRKKLWKERDERTLKWPQNIQKKSRNWSGSVRIRSSREFTKPCSHKTWRVTIWSRNLKTFDLQWLLDYRYEDIVDFPGSSILWEFWSLFLSLIVQFTSGRNWKLDNSVATYLKEICKPSVGKILLQYFSILVSIVCIQIGSEVRDLIHLKNDSRVHLVIQNWKKCDTTQHPLSLRGELMRTSEFYLHTWYSSPTYEKNFPRQKWKPKWRESRRKEFVHVRLPAASANNCPDLTWSPTRGRRATSAAIRSAIARVRTKK